MEINSYWTKVKVDELQGIRNPTKILPFDEDFMVNLENITMFNDKEIAELAGLTTLPMKFSPEDTNSMPDLESVPKIENSEESVVFVFAPENTMCTKSSEKGSLEENAAVFSDEDIIKLAVDEGKDTLTTFNAAMLVNVKGNIEGIQTELYDSGALHHMLPYQDHFENYTPIVPKSITADIFKP